MLPPLPVGSYPTFSPLPAKTLAKKGFPSIVKLQQEVIFFFVTMPSRTSPLSGAGRPVLPGLSFPVRRSISEGEPPPNPTNKNDRTICFAAKVVKITGSRLSIENLKLIQYI